MNPNVLTTPEKEIDASLFLSHTSFESDSPRAQERHKFVDDVDFSEGYSFSFPLHSTSFQRARSTATRRCTDGLLRA